MIKGLALLLIFWIGASANPQVKGKDADSILKYIRFLPSADERIRMLDQMIRHSLASRFSDSTGPELNKLLSYRRSECTKSLIPACLEVKAWSEWACFSGMLNYRSEISSLWLSVIEPLKTEKTALQVWNGIKKCTNTNRPEQFLAALILRKSLQGKNWTGLTNSVNSWFENYLKAPEPKGGAPFFSLDLGLREIMGWTPIPSKLVESWAKIGIKHFKNVAPEKLPMDVVLPWLETELNALGFIGQPSQAISLIERFHGQVPIQKEKGAGIVFQYCTAAHSVGSETGCRDFIKSVGNKMGVNEREEVSAIDDLVLHPSSKTLDEVIKIQAAREATKSSSAPWLCLSLTFAALDLGRLDLAEKYLKKFMSDAASQRYFQAQFPAKMAEVTLLQAKNQLSDASQKLKLIKTMVESHVEGPFSGTPPLAFSTLTLGLRQNQKETIQEGLHMIKEIPDGDASLLPYRKAAEIVELHLHGQNFSAKMASFLQIGGGNASIARELNSALAQK